MCQINDRMPPKFYKKKCKEGHVCHDLHCESEIESSLMENLYLRIVSVDPGYVNFCIRIEDRPRNTQFPGLIKQIYCDVWNLGEDRSMNLTEKLFSISRLIESADYFLVEKQVEDNIKMLKTAQHVVSWVRSFFHGRTQRPKLIEFCPKAKLRAIKCPTTLNKRGYKSWTEEWAKKMFELREDNDSLAIMSSRKKLDDVSDTLAQIEAFCILENFPTSTKIYSKQLIDDKYQKYCGIAESR